MPPPRSDLERFDRLLELVLADVDDVAEGAAAVAHAGRRVHVHAGLEEALVNARQPPERVVPVDEQRVVRAFDLDLRACAPRP